MAKDIYHDIVKRALEKDGWTITHDPYKIPLANRTLKADLAAQKLLVAQKDAEKIVVEVKSFLRDSFIYDFHEAFGQYLVYRRFINLKEPERLIYMAVPEQIFIDEFTDPDVIFLCKMDKITELSALWYIYKFDYQSIMKFERRFSKPIFDFFEKKSKIGLLNLFIKG